MKALVEKLVNLRQLMRSGNLISEHCPRLALFAHDDQMTDVLSLTDSTPLLHCINCLSDFTRSETYYSSQD